MAKKLDREEGERYKLLIAASDGAHNVDTSVEVIVEDENDCAPVFERQVYTGSFSSNMSLPGAVLTVKAVDDDVGKNGQVNVLSVKDTPCPNEVSKGTFWAKPCVWQECSKGQYGWTSCPMYCPPGKNCVGMRKQDHVQVVPDGSSEQGR